MKCSCLNLYKPLTLKAEFFIVCLHLEISKGIFSHEKMLLLEPLQTVCTCTEHSACTCNEHTACTCTEHTACTCTEHTTPPNQPLAWTMIKTGALKHSKVSCLSAFQTFPWDISKIYIYLFNYLLDQQRILQTNLTMG